jgi:hypothetical protein
VVAAAGRWVSLTYVPDLTVPAGFLAPTEAVPRSPPVDLGIDTDA